MANKNEKIYVRVMRNGYIPQLGICGPIPNPILITRAIANSMVVAGIDVYEVNPKTTETKKLTIYNVFDSEPKKEGSVEKPTTPDKSVDAKVKEPVKPVELTGVEKNESKEEDKKEESDVDETKDAEKSDSKESVKNNNKQNNHNNKNNKKK